MAQPSPGPSACHLSPAIVVYVAGSRFVAIDWPQIDSAAGSGDGFGEVVAVVREAVESRRGRRLRPRSCATNQPFYLPVKFYSNAGMDKHKHKGSDNCYIKEIIQVHLCYNSRNRMCLLGLQKRGFCEPGWKMPYP